MDDTMQSHADDVGAEANERELQHLNVNADQALATLNAFREDGEPEYGSIAEYDAAHQADMDAVSGVSPVSKGAWLDLAPVTAGMDEPTEEALAGALFAQVGWLVDDLAIPDTVALLIDTDREGLAKTVHKLDHILQLVGTIRDEAAQALAGLMEGKLELIADLAVERNRFDKTEWDKDSAWRQVRAAMIDRWAIGIGGAAASERIKLVDRVMTDIAGVYTNRTPTVAGLKHLDINPYELRSTTPATRWTVKVTG